MYTAEIISGYLEVKVSAKSRRGLMPWKAWQKQWCEIKKLDNIENGLELKLKSAVDGAVLNCVVLPRSSTICRTDSRTKQYAFGVFTLGKKQKPLLFLSGTSESDSQKWMANMRRMLCVASYLPVGESTFHVSLVDTAHSRAAGLTGLHGVLGINGQEIIISDPCTGEQKISWKWYQFHQFHLQAAVNGVDDKVICVMHTSGDFPSGAGQLYLHCLDAPRLLSHLVARGKRLRSPASNLVSARRLSRSEGDLCSGSLRIGNMCAAVHDVTAPDSPLCFRSSEGGGSEDSGVRVSIGSSEDFVLKSKIASSLISIGMALLTKTPGGSETNGDSLLDLSINEADFLAEPRRVSGTSVASGIYEEIPDQPNQVVQLRKDSNCGTHVYENPIDIILNGERNVFKPPPLPPRLNEAMSDSTYTLMATPYKQRCNTLPAKDLQRISQIFTDSDYTVMSPSKKLIDVECSYVQMSPKARLKAQVENCYMVMTGRK